MKKEIADKIDYNSILFRLLDRINILGINTNQRDQMEYKRAVNLFYINLFPYLDDKFKKEYWNHDEKNKWDLRLQMLLVVADQMGILLDKETTEKI